MVIGTIKTCLCLFYVVFKVANENKNLIQNKFKNVCEKIPVSDRQLPRSTKWFFEHQAIWRVCCANFVFQEFQNESFIQKLLRYVHDACLCRFSGTCLSNFYENEDTKIRLMFIGQIVESYSNDHLANEFCDNTIEAIFSEHLILNLFEIILVREK